MRYELTNYDWAAIKPFLPNTPRGVPPANDRRDLPENFSPCTSCYNRLARWRRAGVSDRLMNALTADQDAAVQMIDASIVRMHQHGACIAGNSE